LSGGYVDPDCDIDEDEGTCRRVLPFRTKILVMGVGVLAYSFYQSRLP